MTETNTNTNQTDHNFIIQCHNVSLDSVFIKLLDNATDKKICKPRVYNLQNFDLIFSGDFNFNYVYIPSFKRYYYADIKEIINNNVTVSLSCDYLMTFKETIIDNCFFTGGQVLNGSYLLSPFRKLGGLTLANILVSYINKVDHTDIEPKLTKRDLDNIKTICNNELIYYNYM